MYNKIKEIPITTMLIAINVIVMAILLLQSQSFTPDAELITKFGALGHESNIWHIVIYGFFHAHLLHISLNMLGLWFLGKELERNYGSLNLLVIYVVSLVGAGISIYYFGTGLTIGASGAILGLIGYNLAMHIKYNASKTKKGSKGLIATYIDLAIIGLISLIPHVSLSAHAGGFISGFVFTYIYYLVVNQEKALNWRLSLET